MQKSQLYVDTNIDKQQSNAVLLGQLLGMIDSCNPNDINTLGGIALSASQMLSPVDNEHNALILFSFASGSAAQARLFLNGKSNITCEQAIELAKTIHKN